MYKLTENGVLRLEDRAWIPDCEANMDWMEYQVWLTEGNTPEPMDIIPEPDPDAPIQPTVESLQQELNELKALMRSLTTKDID